VSSILTFYPTVSLTLSPLLFRSPLPSPLLSSTLSLLSPLSSILSCLPLPLPLSLSSLATSNHFYNFLPLLAAEMESQVQALLGTLDRMPAAVEAASRSASRPSTVGGCTS
jgi:hypothetical protein